MNKDAQLNQLSANELFSLAIYVAEFNTGFFRDWANRMRPFDLGAVEVLDELARDAEHYLDTLHITADRLFDGQLPESNSDLQDCFTRHLELSGNRYFITSTKEANTALGVALSLQK